VVCRLAVVLEADFELLDGAIDGADGFDAVAAIIVCGVFEVFLGMAQGVDGGVNLGMRLGKRRGCGSGISESQSKDGEDGEWQESFSHDVKLLQE